LQAKEDSDKDKEYRGHETVEDAISEVSGSDALCLLNHPGHRLLCDGDLLLMAAPTSEGVLHQGGAFHAQPALTMFAAPAAGRSGSKNRPLLSIS
jgi:hypothetical protein